VKTQDRQLATFRQTIEARPWLNDRWLRRIVSERRVSFHKVGGRLLFDLRDIDALAEAGRVESVS